MPQTPITAGAFAWTIPAIQKKGGEYDADYNWQESKYKTDHRGDRRVRDLRRSGRLLIGRAGRRRKARPLPRPRCPHNQQDRKRRAYRRSRRQTPRQSALQRGQAREPRFDNPYCSVIYDAEEKIWKCWYSIFTRSGARGDFPGEGLASEKRAWVAALMNETLLNNEQNAKELPAKAKHLAARRFLEHVTEHGIYNPTGDDFDKL